MQMIVTSYYHSYGTNDYLMAKSFLTKLNGPLVCSSYLGFKFLESDSGLFLRKLYYSMHSSQDYNSLVELTKY